MKIRSCKLITYVLCVLAGIVQLNAATTTNMTPVIQESWETISNRWGNVSWDNAKKAAIEGDVLAEYYVGCAYQDGNGVDKDLAEAFKWEKMAADNGLVRAQRAVGWMFENGFGTETNTLKAEIFYRESALAGDDQAQFFLGRLLQYGGAKETNLTEAASWYKKSADQGMPDAQMNLGWMYEHGTVVAQDYTEAARLYRLAAEQGHAMAQNNLGWLLANGQGVPKDYDEAQKWLQKAADQGNKLAINNLTWLDSKAFEEQYGQAKKYQKGDGIPRDLVEAFKWMERAAQHDQSHSSKVSDAIYYLALMYESGEGVETNNLKAHELLFQAADGNQPDACYRVGVMTENGDGVPQDYYQAAKFYYFAVFNFNGRKYRGKAAECLLKLYAEGRGLTRTNQDAGDFMDGELANKNNVVKQVQNQVTTPQGEFYAGQIYQQGTLVPQDLVEAAVRFQVAADEGLEVAKKTLLDLEPNMSPSQKEELVKRVRDAKRKFLDQRMMEQTEIQIYGW